jgi:hypothetical protein
MKQLVYAYDYMKYMLAMHSQLNLYIIANIDSVSAVFTMANK